MKIFRFFLITSFLLVVRCERQLSFYVATDFVYVGDFTEGLEGPAVDTKGNLYFVNPKHNGSIGKVDSNGNFSLFIDQLPSGSTANGIRLNSSNNLFLADYTGHNILEIDPKTKRVQVYAHEPNANQPNDLTLTTNDRIYASDPNWGDSTGKIWKIENGKFALLSSNMGTTNGIEVSPDEKILYVNESVQKKVWAFDILEDGNLSNKRTLIEFDDFGMDGMRCDLKGNLYITRYGKGTVVKVSPNGELLKEIQLKGKKPSNIAFGGVDGKTAYVTLQDRTYIETFRVPDPGSTFSKRLGIKE